MHRRRRRHSKPLHHSHPRSHHPVLQWRHPVLQWRPHHANQMAGLRLQWCSGSAGVPRSSVWHQSQTTTIRPRVRSRCVHSVEPRHPRQQRWFQPRWRVRLKWQQWLRWRSRRTAEIVNRLSPPSRLPPGCRLHLALRTRLATTADAGRQLHGAAVPRLRHGPRPSMVCADLARLSLVDTVALLGLYSGAVSKK